MKLQLYKIVNFLLWTQFIEEFISTELEKPSNYVEQTLIILFIIMFENIKNNLKKRDITVEEEILIIKRILEKFNKDIY